MVDDLCMHRHNNVHRTFLPFKVISKVKLLLVRCFDFFTLQLVCSVTTNKL